MESPVDVIVLGAGFAGLSAASHLQAAGRTVLLLEARERSGGRVMPADLAGRRVDLGGQWVGRGHQRLQGLAEAAGKRLLPQHVAGDKLMGVAGQQRRYRGLVPPTSVGAVAGMAWALWRLRGLQRRVPAAAPWSVRDARALDRRSVADWRDRNLPRGQARALFDEATRAVLCIEPDQLSMLAFLHYLAANDGFEALTSTLEGAQAATVDGGMHALAAHLAQPLGDALRLCTPVQAIEQNDDAVVVHAGASSYRGRRAIVAMAPAMAGRIAMTGISGAREQLGQRMPMGSVIKCQIAYRQPFWRDTGLSGEFLGNSESLLSPVFDNSPEDASLGVLTGFIDGDAAVRWSGQAEARRAAVIASLEKAFGSAAAAPLDYVDHDWIADPWSRGCYTGVPTPGTLSRLGPALRAPCGRLHWAGTETAEAWCGYIEGALRSGERAAEEVLEALA